MKYFCPVCAYNNLVSPPKDHSICPCCGTEFGYDDHSKSWDELRTGWINGGARWFSDSTQKPDKWDPFEQLFEGISLSTIAKDEIVLIPTETFGPIVWFEDINPHA